VVILVIGKTGQYVGGSDCTPLHPFLLHHRHTKIDKAPSRLHLHVDYKLEETLNEHLLQDLRGQDQIRRKDSYYPGAR
jgi:hypothetical protein